MNLIGTEKYAYGNQVNPITEKQRTIITVIETFLGKYFDGNTSKEAYAFIGEYHDLVQIRAGKIYVRRHKQDRWQRHY